MTIFKTASQSTQQQKRHRLSVWLEKLMPILDKGMAFLVLLNLCAIFFDISYIPLRDFWLQGKIQLFTKIGPFEREFPQEPLVVLDRDLTRYYDWVKGIEPYRETQEYLKKVEALNREIAKLPKEELNKPLLLSAAREKEIAEILEDLRARSLEMILTNPFENANKTGTLERIKNKMRLHVFKTKDASSKEAFIRFWSLEYLKENGFRRELDFFNTKITPLIATNYYRPVGENGEFIDNFGLIDFFFFIPFSLDFLSRTWWISRRHPSVSWVDAMLWRWYDIFLLIPVWRTLRVIPAIVRLDRSRLLDLTPIKKQASQGFVASIAQDLTEVIFVRIVNQIQGAIRQGEINKILSRENIKQYVDINELNETAEIAKLIAQILVYQVLPKIRPDIEALLRYSIEKFIHQAPAYQRLNRLPGLEQIQTSLTDRLVKQIYQTLFDTLNGLLEDDPAFNQILEQLITNFNRAMASEIQAKQSIKQMESLLVDLLEEIKINYIQRLSEEDVEEILEQTRAVLLASRTSSQLKSTK